MIAILIPSIMAVITYLVHSHPINHLDLHNHPKYLFLHSNISAQQPLIDPTILSKSIQPRDQPFTFSLSWNVEKKQQTLIWRWEKCQIQGGQNGEQLIKELSIENQCLGQSTDADRMMEQQDRNNLPVEDTDVRAENTWSWMLLPILLISLQIMLTQRILKLQTPTTIAPTKQP